MIETPSTFAKSERITGKNSISVLLSKGKWGNCRELKYCYLTTGEEKPRRLMVSVPKKLFKRAVKRNLLKRRIRESYRTRKGLIGVEGGVDLLIQYNTSEILDFTTVRETVEDILKQIK